MAILPSRRLTDESPVRDTRRDAVAGPAVRPANPDIRSPPGNNRLALGVLAGSAGLWLPPVLARILVATATVLSRTVVLDLGTLVSGPMAGPRSVRGAIREG